MNDLDLLARLTTRFSRATKPRRLVIADTEETRAVERDLLLVQPDQMSYAQTANLIVDLALVSDDGVYYLLSRMARAVLFEGGNAFMLLLRLQRLELGRLDPPSRDLIERLLLRLEELEQQLCEAEEKELREGWATWRERLLASGTLDDGLLVAVADGDVAEAKRLLIKGANIKAQDCNGNTALSLAEMSGNAQLVPMIRKWGG